MRGMRGGGRGWAKGRLVEDVEKALARRRVSDSRSLEQVALDASDGEVVGGVEVEAHHPAEARGAAVKGGRK